MPEAQKFLLLDSRDADRMFKNKAHDERLEPLQKRELHGLDRLMLDIVNDTTLSEEEKVKKYNSALTEFQATVGYVPKPPGFPPQRESSPPRYDSTLGIPITFQKKAKNLLSYLTKGGDFSISDKGEIMIKGSKKLGSNISDILNRAVNPKSKLTQPIAWAEFKKLLEEKNAPRSMLAVNVQNSLQTPLPSHSPPKPRRQRNSPPKPAGKLRDWTAHDSKDNGKKTKVGQKLR